MGNFFQSLNALRTQNPAKELPKRQPSTTRRKAVVGHDPCRQAFENIPLTPVSRNHAIMPTNKFVQLAIAPLLPSARAGRHTKTGTIEHTRLPLLCSALLSSSPPIAVSPSPPLPSHFALLSSCSPPCTLLSSSLPLLSPSPPLSHHHPLTPIRICGVYCIYTV